MSTPAAQALDQVRSALRDPRTLVRAVGTADREANATGRRMRCELRYVALKRGLSLQLVVTDSGGVLTRNGPAGTAQADALVDEALQLPVRTWSVETTAGVLQVRRTKRNGAVLHRSPVREPASPLAVSRQHDRAKGRLLGLDHPVFAAVGITDADGAVKARQGSKYRQVDEFLRIFRSALDTGFESRLIAPPTTDRPLQVVDFGCGNAYLTFATAAYLVDVRRLPTRLVGVDRRPDVQRRNTRLAASLGLEDVLEFPASTIADVVLADTPTVVVALHACDTATDEALARAIWWRAPVVLVAPCCHHDLQRQLNQASSPAPYGLLTRHGTLKERFGDVLTDALRSSLLGQQGYAVDAVQFVADEHTPRNVLVRAVRTDRKDQDQLREEYVALTKQWGLEPALGRMLQHGMGPEASLA